MQNNGVEKLIKHLILSGDTSGLRELITNSFGKEHKENSVPKR